MAIGNNFLSRSNSLERALRRMERLNDTGYRDRLSRSLPPGEELPDTFDSPEPVNLTEIAEEYSKPDPVDEVSIDETPEVEIPTESSDDSTTFIDEISKIGRAYKDEGRDPANTLFPILGIIEAIATKGDPTATERAMGWYQTGKANEMAKRSSDLEYEDSRSKAKEEARARKLAEEFRNEVSTLDPLSDTYKNDVISTFSKYYPDQYALQTLKSSRTNKAQALPFSQAELDALDDLPIPAASVSYIKALAEVDPEEARKVAAGYAKKPAKSLAEQINELQQKELARQEVEKPSGSEFTAGRFAYRMKGAEDIITDLEKSGYNFSGFWNNLMTSYSGDSVTLNGLINLARTPEQQRYMRSMWDFITANLREESGAAIAKDEFVKEVRKFFPAMGDKPEVLQDKREARIRAIDGMAAEAGRTLDLIMTQIRTQTNAQADTQANIPTSEPEPDSGWIELEPGIRVKRVE